MKFEQLTPEQVDALVETRHNTTDIEFPPQGMQPYHRWLVRTLHRLAECSLGALRVDRGAGSATEVAIAPGRASIDDTAVAWEGGVLDLASFNNATARVWLAEDEGTAVVDADDDWPASPHLKLAEVTLSAGAIEAVVDRRLEAVFRV